MKQLKTLWHRLSPKKQVAVHLCTVMVLLFLCYALLGSPPLTLREAFRRAEKAALTGPGEILAQLTIPDYPYDGLVLAKDPDGVTVFAYDRKDQSRTQLVYRAHTDEITVLAAPGDILYQYKRTATVPLILFHDREDANRAEMDITLQLGSFQKTYTLTAQQEAPGCFCFLLECRSSDALGEEGAALRLLQEISSNSMAGNLEAEFPVFLRLYGEDGTLILESETSVRSAAAHAQLANP